MTLEVKAGSRLKESEVFFGELDSPSWVLLSLVHELSQPLSAMICNISGCITKLQHEENDNRDVVEVLKKTLSQAHYTGSVVHRFKQFLLDQTTSGHYVDINDVIARVLNLISFRLVESNINVQLKLDHQLPMVKMGALQLEQVLLNILNNAIDSLKNADIQEKQIVIRSELISNDVVQVGIADNGHGIAHDVMNHLFNPRVTTKEEGMGIGLYLSRQMVANYGGQLTVNPNNSLGTEFLLTLSVKGE